MNSHAPRRRSLAARIATACALVASTLGVASLGTVVTATPAQADQNVVVSPTPVASAPRPMNGRVYAIDTYGPLVAVGGTFTTIRPGTSTTDVPRQWIFMYNRDTGQIIDSFNPQLTGPAPETTGLVKDTPGVEAIQFAPDGKSLYVGGWFTNVNGKPVNRLARLNLDGSLNTTFKGAASGVVMDMALVGNRLIVGGRFKFLSGEPTDHLGAVDLNSGARLLGFDVPVTVSRDAYQPFVQELEPSPNGRYLAVAGNFEKVGNETRKQLAIIDLSGTPSVANWSTDVYAGDCSPATLDTYIHGIGFSPDSSFLVVATTGAFIGPNLICDTAARFEMPPTSAGDNQKPTWVNHTGGDTFWAVHITSAAVYIGGHQRWVNNPAPSPKGDNDGPGAIARPGIVALDPLNGVPLSWNPTRDRGRGAEAIVSDDQYLYVGHDTDYWGGQLRQRLAQLPVAGGAQNPAPDRVQLPVNMTVAVGSQLQQATFNGSTFGTFSDVSGGVNWSEVRGGFFQRGAFVYFGANQAYYRRSLTGTSTWSGATNLSTTVGYVDADADMQPYDQPYGVAETTAATYRDGWMYYVLAGDGRLLKRGYSIESGIIGTEQQLVSGGAFANARALDYIGNWLYAAWSDGKLYRFYAPNGQVDYSSKQLVDNGATINWSQVHGMYSRAGSGTAVEPTAPSANCSGSTPWTAKYWPNTGLEGTPVTTRCEADVNQNWGTNAPPNSGVPADYFSGQWTRTVNLAQPGALQFQALGDDGIRVYVDGKLVVDGWVYSTTPYQGTSQNLAAGNHTVRVEMFEGYGEASVSLSMTTVAPAPEKPTDAVAPTTTLNNPTMDQVVTTSTLQFRGNATDNVGVAGVRVAVQNRDTLDYLQTDGSWAASYAFRPANLTAPNTTATNWSLSLSLPDGKYVVDVKSQDAAKNLSPSARARFVINSGPVDSTSPDTAVDTPTTNQVVTSPFTATGTATDNVGVTKVNVAVYNRSDSVNKWLQADGTFGPKYVARPATLDKPGEVSTNWSLTMSLPAGLYGLDVVAVDGTGNRDATSAWRTFQVGSDAAAPTATISTTAAKYPNGRAIKTGSTGLVVVKGKAKDNQSVLQVKIAVKRLTNAGGRPWMQAKNVWGKKRKNLATIVGAPGKPATNWSTTVKLKPGKYKILVFSQDAMLNKSRTPATKTITVVR